jgi:hypothetical protein
MAISARLDGVAHVECCTLTLTLTLTHTQGRSPSSPTEQQSEREKKKKLTHLSLSLSLFLSLCLSLRRASARKNGGDSRDGKKKSIFRTSLPRGRGSKFGERSAD